MKTLSELVIEWGNAYVKDCQDRFIPVAEKYLREQIPELEDYEIVWTSELGENSDV